MEFKYDIGFLIPKYGEIISRKNVGKDTGIKDIRYRVKMNYDDPESEATNMFTEEVIDYYIEQYLSKNKNYTTISFEGMQKLKEEKLREYAEEINRKKKI